MTTKPAAATKSRNASPYQPGEVCYEVSADRLVLFRKDGSLVVWPIHRNTETTRITNEAR